MKRKKEKENLLFPRYLTLAALFLNEIVSIKRLKEELSLHIAIFNF